MLPVNSVDSCFFKEMYTFTLNNINCIRKRGVNDVGGDSSFQ